jgi:hypothetical protein
MFNKLNKMKIGRGFASHSVQTCLILDFYLKIHLNSSALTLVNVNQANIFLRNTILPYKIKFLFPILKTNIPTSNDSIFCRLFSISQLKIRLEFASICSCHLKLTINSLC